MGIGTQQSPIQWGLRPDAQTQARGEGSKRGSQGPQARDRPNRVFQAPRHVARKVPDEGAPGNRCSWDPPEAFVGVVVPAPPWAEKTPPPRTSLVTPQRLGPGFLPGSPVRPTPRTETTSMPEEGPMVQGCPPLGSRGLMRPPCSHSSLVPLSCLTGPALLQGTASEGTFPGALGGIHLSWPSVPQTPQVQLGDSEGQQGTEGPRLGRVCPAGDACLLLHSAWTWGHWPRPWSRAQEPHRRWRMDIALPGGPPRMGTEAQNRPQMQRAAESLTPSPQRTLHAMSRVSGGFRTPKPPDSWGTPGQEPWYNGPFPTLTQQGQCPLAPPGRLRVSLLGVW